MVYQSDRQKQAATRHLSFSGLVLRVLQVGGAVRVMGGGSGLPKDGADVHERESLLGAKGGNGVAKTPSDDGLLTHSAQPSRPPAKLPIPPMKALTGARGIAAMYVCT